MQCIILELQEKAPPEPAHYVAVLLQQIVSCLGVSIAFNELN
jgi:hypothetical protein